jgi:hypothetical protein
MIQANELRIGNYVNVPREDQSPFRIDAFESLSEKFIKVAMVHPEHGENFHPLTWYGEDLQPIPLTEEWLLKLGFLKYKGDNKDFWLNDFEFANDLKWIFWRGNILENIKHVHQLQNLYFALTNKELQL